MYLVQVLRGAVVGCGGIWLADTGLPGQAGSTRAGLSWGMVHRDLHGQGLGYALLQHRLSLIRQYYPRAQEVRIDTSQYTEPHVLRQGFVTMQRRPDGFAPGPDEIQMVRRPG